MALQRRLAFFFLTVSSLLCIYILCMSLEVQVPWRMQDPASLRCAADTPSPSRSRTSEEPLQRSKGDLSNDGPASLGTTLAAATTTTATTAGTLDFAADGSQPPGGKNPTPLVNVIDPSPESYAKDEVRTNEGLANVPPTHAAKTTEPPYIGDTYSSEDIPPQSACTDAISKKLSTTDFSGRFLRTIPVLQWAKHITPKEYERLKQYPGAHGWGGIDYQTLVATLSVLNLPANREMFDGREHMQNGSRCIRCAVVGNGGILKDSQKGKEIDGHDYVFRTNGAIIQGFEMDVGSRTTHYCFSTNTLRNSMRSYAGLGYRGPPVSKETRYIFLPDHDRDYLLMKAVATHTPVERGPERSNSPPNYFGENASAETLKMYHPDFIRYIRNRFLRSRTLKTKYKDIYRPSTGAVMLLAAVHTCDQVSAYGFMTSDYSKYSDHYYDNQYRPVGFYVNHDLRMELELWQQLHHAGLLRLYMR